MQRRSSPSSNLNETRLSYSEERDLRCWNAHRIPTRADRKKEKGNHQAMDCHHSACLGVSPTTDLRTGWMPLVGDE